MKMYYVDMIGKTMVSVVVGDDNYKLIFTDTDEVEYIFYHEQSCCESVYIDDICGDLTDLENSPMLNAEEVSSDHVDTQYGSETWTFYKFSTIKGSVTVKWFGQSNGWYSENVDFMIKTPFKIS